VEFLRTQPPRGAWRGADLLATIQMKKVTAVIPCGRS
jgi:hypothetical protein